MAWLALLESILALHRGGMTIAMALEQHGRWGTGESGRLAWEWTLMRHDCADPVRAMRALAPRAIGPFDRFALETLVLCLERPAVGHDATLAAALEQLTAERVHRRPRRLSAAWVAATLLLPGAFALVRLLASLG